MTLVAKRIVANHSTAERYLSFSPQEVVRPQCNERVTDASDPKPLKYESRNGCLFSLAMFENRLQWRLPPPPPRKHGVTAAIQNKSTAYPGQKGALIA